jgi:ankyrin repeat protein
MRCRYRVSLLLVLAVEILAVAAPAIAQNDDVRLREQHYRSIVQSSIEPLQRSADLWIQRKDCVSCHHQGVGGLAVEVFREKGFVVSEGLRQKQIAAILRRFTSGTAEGLVGVTRNNPQFGDGYLMLPLGASARPADTVTDIAMHLLSGMQTYDGAWRSESHRAPLEEHALTATALAARALIEYPPPGVERIEGQVHAAQQYLLRSTTSDTEERVMQLLGLYWTGSDRATLDPLLETLAATQGSDGGFAQIVTRPSDAYATGQVLVVLQQVGGWGAVHPVVARGLEFLASNWDGEARAWRVSTRRRLGGLPYFETGFPFGEDQFISYAGSAWASMALALASVPGPSRALVAVRQPRANDHSSEAFLAELAPIHRAAMFGNRQDLVRLLEAGVDPDLAGPEEVTPLMLAVHSPDLVKELLARGADADRRAASGETAVHRAAAWPGGEKSLRLLIAAGGSVARNEQSEVSPLHWAAARGNREALALLLDGGASIDERSGRIEDEGGTALLWATMLGDLETTRFLLERGADPNLGWQGGEETALLVAAVDGFPEIVRELLRHGARVDSRGEQGRDVLQYAVLGYRGNDDILRQLLAASASPAVADEVGRTALSIARDEGLIEVERLLSSVRTVSTPHG